MTNGMRKNDVTPIRGADTKKSLAEELLSIANSEEVDQALNGESVRRIRITVGQMTIHNAEICLDV